MCDTGFNHDDLARHQAYRRPLWDAHARSRYQIEQGLELGAYVFLRMYRDLYVARGRRLVREIDGPHSLADGWFVPKDGAGVR